VLFTEFPGGGIQRVSADGGTPVAVTQINAARRELNHYWPELLPDGRHFLYLATALDANGIRTTPGVYIGNLDGGEATLLVRMHSRMTFVAPGYLLFVQDSALLAQPFDPDRLQLTGNPRTIAEDVAYFRTLGNSGFTVSNNGVLAYQGGADPLALRWYDRSGAATSSGWSSQNFGSIRISPDGHRVAVDVADPRIGTSDIWIYDASRGAPVRLTTDLTNESGPVWSPDGRQVLFRSERRGAPNLYANTIGSGTDRLIVSDPSPLTPEDWAPDGRSVVYVRNTRQTGTDIWRVSLDPVQQPRPFAVTRFQEWSAKFSPDGRWLAFVSTDTGSAEVYVAPVEESGNRTRVSTGGGTTPRWRGDGRELYYMSADGRTMMSASITTGAGFQASLPARLFSIGEVAAARNRARDAVYDVTPDGRRFLVSLPAGEPSSSRVTVVLNWTAALVK
jgi:eukaryotic-like serine/threonine-protein kinase